jgi:hypothetical protein
MDILDIFWLICKIAIALAMFLATCFGLYFLFVCFLHWRFKRMVQNERTRSLAESNRERIESNREWLLSLDRVRLLILTTEENSGFDKQDKQYLVELADNVHSEEEKRIIVNRLTKRLTRQFK